MRPEMQSSGLPWLTHPVQLHSSRKDTCTLTPTQCAYRRGHWRYWYEADHVYALNTLYFICATVAVFALVHAANHYAPRRVTQTLLWRRATGVMRYLGYAGSSHVSLPSLGVSLLGLLGTVFFLSMTLAPTPYYWPNTDAVSFGSSPPLATRTGWMALALLPFVLVLGAKANLVSMVTGVAPEKLQVFHHWTSYAMFVLALVHTFPFVVYHVARGDMVVEWESDLTYWTGVAALVPQAYLTVMSVPCVRNRFYEFFKATHFLAALLFLLFFFFHCDFRLSSWDYFIATAALYLLSLAISTVKTTLINGRHTATLDLLPCGLVCVRIRSHLTWRPGQHIFVRFLSPQLGLHCLTAHPFTIASVAQADAPREMVLYVQARGGITGRLARIAAREPGKGLRVLLEGPYGGVQTPAWAPDDDGMAVVVAGGAGAGFSLGVVQGALDEGRCNVMVVYATRSRAVADWYTGEILQCVRGHYGSGRRVEVVVHVTGGTGPAVSSDGKRADVKGVSAEEMSILQGRPDLPALVKGLQAKKTAVYVCGPASMVRDVRNAAAAAQRNVLLGSVDEVMLHTELFSW